MNFTEIQIASQNFICFTYPDENANAVSRVSGEFKVFKSLPTNLDFGFIALWLSTLLRDVLLSFSCDAIEGLFIALPFNFCQIESGVVDIIPVPIVPNCWWKVLTIFGWACPTEKF